MFKNNFTSKFKNNFKGKLKNSFKGKFKNMTCRRPSGPKPEIQHNRRGRGVPTLT